MKTGALSQEIQDQIDKLFSEILIEQRKINALKPADPDKSREQQRLIDELAKMRGREFIYPYFSAGRGHGPFTELIDGSVKYDLIGGIGPGILGHSHPLYIKANLEAATSDHVMCGNLMPYAEAHNLSQRLLEQVSQSRLRHFWFAGSGSFANDSALKMIWQKKAPKYKVLAFEKAFAGRSVATQDITHNPNYRVGMPENIEVDYVPHFDHQNPDLSLSQTLDALEEHWKQNGDVYCALMIELIQGEAGFIYGTSEFYQEIFRWAKDKGLYIWVDEIQTFARTRELFAFQYFHLDEFVDVVTIGKALQACGTLFTEELNPKPGLIAGTFNGSLASLRAGEKIISYLCQGPFYGDRGRSQQIEQAFLRGLRKLAEQSCQGLISDARGIGTMLSFQVGDGSREITKKYLLKLFENGVIAFSAGADPTRVRLLVPFSIKDEHIEEAMKIMEQTAKDVL